MRFRRGYMEMGEVAIAVIVAVLVLLLVGASGFSCWNKHIHGNKQFIDMKQNFNVAYVLGDGGKFEKVKVKAWNDYEKCDAVQVVCEDGSVIFTHLRNVKLCIENPTR